MEVVCGHQFSSSLTLLTSDRPVNDVGERVTPSNLATHRLSHHFLGPCCICPAIFDDVTTFTEAAFVMMLSGRCTGQYVAQCARGQCKYFGESSTVISTLTSSDPPVVPLEDMYIKIGTPLCRYPRRGIVFYFLSTDLVLMPILEVPMSRDLRMSCILRGNQMMKTHHRLLRVLRALALGSDSSGRMR
jgi:hypothetical protein